MKGCVRFGEWVAAALLLAALAAGAGAGPVGRASAQADSFTFPSTGKTVKGRFYDYWVNSGAMTKQGIAVSDEMQEMSEVDGKTYLVQYFEKAVFELHPENKVPYDVLLSLLGRSLYKQKYPGGAPGQMPNESPSSQLFPETGKRVGCQFLDYWMASGGLMQFGYPISDEIIETSEVSGKPVRVQYFERAVLKYDERLLERFTTSAGAEYVVAAQLGKASYQAKHLGEKPQVFVPTQPAPTSTTECTRTLRGPSESDAFPDPPVRASVGKGLVVKGMVRSTQGCAPISNASVKYVVAGPDGEYDADHEGKVFTDSSGAYKFETNFPGFYGAGGPHVHLYIEGEGYRSLETEIFVACGQTEGSFDVVLAPSLGQ